MNADRQNGSIVDRVPEMSDDDDQDDDHPLPRMMRLSDDEPTKKPAGDTIRAIVQGIERGIGGKHAAHVAKVAAALKPPQPPVLREVSSGNS